MFKQLSYTNLREFYDSHNKLVIAISALLLLAIIVRLVGIKMLVILTVATVCLVIISEALIYFEDKWGQK